MLLSRGVGNVTLPCFSLYNNDPIASPSTSILINFMFKIISISMVDMGTIWKCMVDMGIIWKVWLIWE